MPRMNMTWIPLHLDVPEHPKTKRFARIAKITTTEAVGLLVKTWIFAVRFGREGSLGGYSDEELAIALDVDEDDTERIIGAMLRAGWLERDDEGTIRIHDWEEHVGRHLRSLEDRRERDRLRKQSGSEIVPAEIRTKSDAVPMPFHDVSTTVVADSATAAADSTTAAADSEFFRAYNTEQNRTEHHTTGQDRTGHSTRVRARGTSETTAIVPAESSSGRPRDDIWDAFTESLGETFTAAERSRRGKVVKELRAAGINGDQVRRAIANWPNVMGSATCTETGIGSHIGKLLAGFQSGGRTSGIVLTQTVAQRATQFVEKTAEQRAVEAATRDDAYQRTIAEAQAEWEREQAARRGAVTDVTMRRLGDGNASGDF